MNSYTTALLLYDTFLTLDREISFVWVRGRALMTVLLVTIRHGQIASVVLNLIAYDFGPSSAQVSLHISVVSRDLTR